MIVEHYYNSWLMTSLKNQQRTKFSLIIFVGSVYCVESEQTTPFYTLRYGELATRTLLMGMQFAHHTINIKIIRGSLISFCKYHISQFFL